MLNLVKMELYKLKKQKLPAILFAAVIAISAFSAFSQINLAPPGSQLTGKLSFSNAFQDIFMLFMIAVFAGFYIGSDFSNRTIQAQLSKGHKRTDIILSKAFIFSIGAGLLMLLYPVTVCIIHTAKYGWGEPFGVVSVMYIVRIALPGSLLNIGTAGIYVCLAFLCKDIPKTICVCFAFPVVFSAISSTLGRQFSVIGQFLDGWTLSQLKYIVSGKLSCSILASALLSACITIAAALALSSYLFSNTEIK